ncbi:MAG: pseudaminic acid synthase [Bacteroidia bacterium]|nr:pseudaminic acid synthase [Bacteroidia bacterium]
MIKDIQIGKFTIGEGHAPFCIAEMSGNHNQSLERALEIVDAAAATGAHALKLQTYTADTITMDVRNEYFTIEDPNSLWAGKNLYDLYQEAYTPWEWHEPIFNRAREHGMEVFSTPFDDTAVDFLETLGVNAYKVASFENTDHPLIRKIASKGKPIIMSTGAASVQDISESVKVMRDAGCEDIILLKCTSTYPATPENSNLNTIPVMREVFNCHIGLSDHTMGVGSPIAATALGARVIEKHFTLRRADGGVDSAFSLEPEEFKTMVIETERAFLAMGKVQFNVQEVEKKSLKFKRSIFIEKDIQPGEPFTTENIRVIRPGYGLEPKFFDLVLGRQASKNLKRGQPLTWDDLI